MAAITRYKDGDAQVVLHGDLEKFARQILTAAQTATIAKMEEEAEKIASEARSAWYSQVKRRTGKTGDIQVYTTIDASQGVVKVSIGSSDTRLAGKKPAWVLVKRPGPGSLIKQQVTVEEYWATPAALRGNFRPRKANEKKGWPADNGTGPYIYVLNPLASDGKNLATELVRKPAMQKIKELAPLIVAALKAEMARGGR